MQINLKQKQLFENLGGCLDEGIPVLEHFVTKYGISKVPKCEKTLEIDVHHDYILFCITKSLKSIKAAFLLLSEGYFQDALIVLRTVYENYLNSSYLLKNPTKTEEIVSKKLGLAAGTYSLIKNEKGKMFKFRLRDNKTGTVEDFENLTLYKLSENTEYPEDKLIHKKMYKYLSEFIHPNMICSGSYRNDDENYSIEENSNSIDTMWLSAYLLTITLQFTLHFNLNDLDRKDIVSKLKSNSKDICAIIDEFLSLDGEEELKKMFVAIRDRVIEMC